MRSRGEDDREDSELLECAMRRLHDLDARMPLPVDIPPFETCVWQIAEGWTRLRSGELQDGARRSAKELANKILALQPLEKEPKLR